LFDRAAAKHAASAVGELSAAYAAAIACVADESGVATTTTAAASAEAATDTATVGADRDGVDDGDVTGLATGNAAAVAWVADNCSVGALAAATAATFFAAGTGACDFKKLFVML
jgi:hypothetical protein